MNASGKNTYAVIDAIIQKTFEDQPERANIASGRIRAVKYANDLINQTFTHTVLLKTLLLQEFVPYGEARFHAEGPDIELSSDMARHLVLAFHELVTNAVKYGALSKPGGRVLISWKDVEGVVRLEWREEGGPIVPTEGARIWEQDRDPKPQVDFGLYYSDLCTRGAAMHNHVPRIGIRGATVQIAHCTSTVCNGS